jgi:hypothetical protein
VIEATTTTTAITAPSSAERTGAASRPEPEPRAERMPATAVGGRPQAAAARATLELRSTSPPARPARCGATRYATATADPLRTTTKRTNPAPKTVQSNATPRSGYTDRTGPIGASGDSPTATATASSDPVTTAPATPISPSQTAMAGPAPSARKTAPSSALRRTRRLAA